jgi:UDP-N-acetylmuramate dehydrogenase
VVSKELAESLAERYPNMPSYPAPNGVKLAAGWLIDTAGWKGYRNGDAGIHEKQALVLVNYGEASGAELLELAHKIIDDVQQRFGITLHPEVNLI